jgi:hypothetical protein
VIPIQIVMKAMTMVMIWTAEALRPWKRTCNDVEIIDDSHPFLGHTTVVTMEQNVT